MYAHPFQDKEQELTAAVFRFFVTARQSFKALKQPQSRARRVPVKQTDGKTLSSTDRTRRRAIKVQLTTWVVWVSSIPRRAPAETRSPP